MKNKKIFLLILMLLVCILSVQALSATEYTANKEVTSIDNNQKNNIETNIQYDDVSTENKNDELILEENKNDEERKSETDKTTSNENSLTFTDLNTIINGNENSTIYLSNNYTYDSNKDTSFKEKGITISRNLTIYGNGVTLDGNNQARMFRANDGLNVNFYNINFINGQSGGWSAGAIWGANAYNCTFTECVSANNCAGAMMYGNAYDCTFTSNTAGSLGGATMNVNAYNCTFSGNSAIQAGAMYGGNAVLCIFKEDTDTTVKTEFPAVINVLNYKSTYQSGDKLQFNLTAEGKLYNGLNTTIKIYKGTSLLKTVYGLTGEGWVVDLDVGEYTAVLSLTDYPKENSTNATITVTNPGPGPGPTPKDQLIVKNVKMYYADGTKLIVKALNAQGKPKAKLTVNVKVAGKTFKLKTNSKGIAQLAIKLDPNTYKVITTVPGTSIKKVSTMTVNKWKKSLTSLKPKNLVMVYNTNKRFYVTLKHNKVRIAGEYIKVQVLKYTYYIKTNNKGVASLGIHYYPGTWKAKVSIDIAGVKLTKTAKIVVKKR